MIGVGDARSSRCRRSRWAQVDLAVLRPRALALGRPPILIAAWPETAAAFLLLALLGVGNTLVDVTGSPWLQRTASDAVLGRVFGAFEALALLAMGIGAARASSRLVPGPARRGARRRPDHARDAPPVLAPPGLDRRSGPGADRAGRAPGWHPDLRPLPAPQLERLAQSLVDVRIEPDRQCSRRATPATAST